MGLARYVQNHVYDGAFGAASGNDHHGIFHRDSVTELYFASKEDMGRTFADDYTRTVVAPDGRNFAELATNAVGLTFETVVQPMADGAGRTKIMQFLFPAGNDIEALQQRWAERERHAKRPLSPLLVPSDFPAISIDTNKAQRAMPGDRPDMER
ncbi:MAG: EthD domain-containing protein [Sphingobium sp.]